MKDKTYFHPDTGEMLLPRDIGEFIELVSSLFPPRILNRDEDHSDYLRYCGKVELIEWMQKLHEDMINADQEVRS
jgi:hypothetical protein